MNLKRLPLTYLRSRHKDFFNAFGWGKFLLGYLLTICSQWWCWVCSGKGQVLLPEPHCVHRTAELLLEKFQDEILLFRCNKKALAEL